MQIWAWIWEFWDIFTRIKTKKKKKINNNNLKNKNKSLKMVKLILINKCK